MNMRLKLRETIGTLEKILRETEEKPIKDAEGNTYIVCGSYTYFGKALKRFLSDSGEEEEDCSCDLVKELVDENEHLKNQVHNLTLYLQATKDVMTPLEWDFIRSKYSGLPGYCPEE